MKRILALAMCLALMLTSVVVASADVDATITVDIIEGPVSAGEDVEVCISISEWANAYAVIELELEYDESLLEIDVIEQSEFSGAMSATNGNKFSLLCNPSSDRQANKLLGGEICIAYFVAIADITESIPVNVTANVKGYAQGKADGWTATQDLNVEIENGGIMVDNVWPPVEDDNEEIECDATITVDTIEGPISAGEEVEVCISITEWANAYAVIELELEYDESLLELDIIEQSEFSGAMGASNENKFSLVCNPSSDRQANKLLGGEICVAYFVAAADITESIPVNVTANVKGYANGSGDGWVATQALTVEIENGGIMVDDVWPPVEDDDTHECAPAGDIQYDETNHWYNCETVGCGILVNVAPHEGGEATCSAKAVCSVCNAEYGALAADVHKNTETINAKSADCGNNGYTGNTYCNDCKKVTAYGEAIPATGAHIGGTATCVSKAVCTVCSQAYGAFDATNHVGGTKVVNKTVTYTGDKQCNSCGAIVEYGEAIIPDGENPGFVIISDATGKEGDEVTVTVSLGENTAMAAYSAVLVFDETALQLVEMTRGDFCASVNKATKIANGFSVENVTEGSLFSATFKILATTGSYEVDLAFSTAVTIDGAPVDMNVTKGIVTVECQHDDLSEIKYDETNHWYECNIGCGNLVNVAPHEGGEATCSAKAKCTVCGAEYGAFATDVHKNTVVKNAAVEDCGNDGYTGDTFCNDCQTVVAYGDVIPATGLHVGGEATCCAKAKCTVCGQEYGAFATDVHKNTMVINAKVEDCGNDGYTGDTFCNDCQKVIAYGNTIPATGAHVGGEATCSALAVCDVCGQAYGEINANNHKDTKVINKKDADCSNDGYTGDTFCNDCQTVIEEGQVIPAIGYHVGGEATCIGWAECTVCGNEYGEINLNNHKNTEIRFASDNYTGDTYCKDCYSLVKTGEFIKVPVSTITVDTIKGPFAKGDEIAIPIRISKWANAYGIIQFDLIYDDALLKLNSIELSETNFGGSFTDFNKNTFVLVASPSTAEQAQKLIGGEICVAYFTVVTDITVNTSISLSNIEVYGYVTGEEDTWTAYKPFEVNVVNGNIEHSCAPKEEIKYDANNHWYECTIGCGNLINVAPHEGGEATCSEKAKCSVCGVEYGNIDTNNHVGKTETCDYIAEDCGNNGYTGDIYCLDCGVMIQKGTVIPATGKHVGGTATCKDKAICTVCGQEYGEVDANNHAGETETRDAVAVDCGNNGYTGDTYCKDCGVITKKGNTIPATGKHKGGTATCTKKAICTVCGQEHGEFGFSNHTGKTEIRNNTEFYTGDTYCLDCEGVVKFGETVEVILPELKEMKSTITIGSIEGPIAANEEIVLPVTISEWSNAYKKIEIVVDYDSSLLELDAIMISKNNFNGASFDYRKNKFTIEASPLSENQAQKVDGGEFCTIHFFANTYFEDATNVTLTAKIVGYSYGSEDKWKNTQQATVEVVAGGVIAGVPTECTHTGETEIRDAKEPTCGKKGSGGDTYCLDCGVKLAIDPIPATGNHIGGSASCCIQAVCDVCYQSYGELNNNLHIGGTELINKSETYTGDTYCMGCNTQLSKGEVIECTHEGGEATCCSKAVCEKCNAEYGEFDANNHAGETEIRDKSETYTGDTYCLGCGEMLTQGEEIKPAGILGDANGDGKINAMDAMIVSQYYVELPVSINVDVADVNGDGKINAMDAMLISQFYVELIPEFPAKQ